MHGSTPRAGVVPALLLALLLALCAARPAAAVNATLGEQRDLQNLTIYFENDLFTGTDEHYTNAVKLTWLSADLSDYEKDPRLPEWAVGLIRHLPFVNEPDLERNVAFSFGQNIYTPRDTQDPDLIDDDRPYAGWLYGSIGLHSKTARQLDTFELTAGVVGPSSLAEQSQNEVHRLRSFQTAKGWDNQLKDEPGLMASWQRTFRFFSYNVGRGWGFDMLPHLGATVGNVLTYANAGGEMRFGYNLPYDFGTWLIHPGAGIKAPYTDSDGSSLSKFGLHVFGGTDGRAVARNIFLDGNTWKDSHHVDKNIFVADLMAGVALTYDTFKLSYAQVYRTEEFVGQDSGQLFGSVSLSWSF